ncbi:hypothetical protein GALMADRAFT_252259 [Galerina marginata CBS 339.88]|uniref:F-box domain-containing protein n=1 Tax=Galerina marginata (strain CBS 339.88) TaxID=685588 RepID=A0A067SZ03_GALM3|nr:hypothetical protein GALMADRAFT_252259 [Galerina marginata CBS 339.88]
MDPQPSVHTRSGNFLEPNANDRGHEPSPYSSPISCLSEDLLTLILHMVRDSFDDLDDSAARAKVPFIASHVSRFWRFCAIGYPFLWSTIVIILPWNQDIVEAYLRRSKQCFLDISFMGNDEIRSGFIPTVTSEDYQHLFSLLLPHFPRCRSLDTRRAFDNDDANIPFTILEQLLETDMPHLDKLILAIDPYIYDDEFTERGVQSLFPSSPLLRDLRVVGIGVERFSLPSSPFSNRAALKTLHLSRISGYHTTTFSELKVVLQACPSLTSLAIYDDLLSDWPGISDSFEVPTLESIYILGNMLTVSELLLYLISPNLKELVVAPFVPADLNLLFAQSSNDRSRFSSLRELKVALANADAYEALQKASACFPEVEYILLASLHHFDFTEFFTFKGEGDDTDFFFPNLLDLALTDVDETYCKGIRDVQVFRAQHHLPLRTVYVDSDSLQLIKSKIATEGQTLDLDVVEGNFWEALRKGLLYSEDEGAFVGRF